MNKRGYVQDILFLGLVLFLLSIVVIVASKLNQTFNTNYQNMPNVSSDSRTLMNNMSSRYYGIFDNIFIMVFIFMAITVFATIFLLDTHPALFFIIMIVLGLILMVLAMVGNSYHELANNQVLLNETSNMNYLDNIMDNWIVILLGISGIAIVLLFARSNR